ASSARCSMRRSDLRPITIVAAVSTPAAAKPAMVIVLPMLDAALPSAYAPKAYMPDHSTPAGRVGYQEPGPAHRAEPGEERGVGAQHGDASPEEDDRHAVPDETGARRLEPNAVQADVMPVPLGQAPAAGLAGPVPGVVADDGRGGRGVEVVCCSGIECRGDERGLAWQRDPQAFGGDERKHRVVAVG